MRAAPPGATIQHPGWGGADVGVLPFPTRGLKVHRRLVCSLVR